MAFEKLRTWLNRQLAVTDLERMLYPPLRLPVTFRRYEDKDFEALLKIYELNAPGRFPEKSLYDFVKYLRSGQQGIIVGELDGKAICTGGLIQSGENIFILCYGLIHPEYQRQRIGSTMALLRIAATGRKESWQFVYTMINAVPASIPYYKQFGFTDAGIWLDRDGKSYPSAMVVYQVNVAKRVAAELSLRGVKVQGGLEPHQHHVLTTMIKPNDQGVDMVHFEWIHPQPASEEKPS
jgi:ribosomal protein S18 acetylase RimI-like enzyme